MFNPQSVIPTVVEDTGRGERAFDIYSMLLKRRIILVTMRLPQHMQIWWWLN